MEKRTKLALLIVGVLVLLGIGVYFLLSPYLEQRAAQQPPALPEDTTPVLPKSRPRPMPGETPTTTIPQVEINDEAKLRMLETKSMTVMERLSSGSSSDGFSGYQDVAGDFTAEGRSWLRTEQQKMAAAHPVKGQPYGISARAVSSKLDPNAKWGDSTILVTVQLILKSGLATEAGMQTAQKAELTYERQSDGSYLISTVKLSEIAL